MKKSRILSFLLALCFIVVGLYFTGKVVGRVLSLSGDILHPWAGLTVGLPLIGAFIAFTSAYIFIANRYITNALSVSRKNAEAIKNDQYQDVLHADEILA